MKKLSMLFLMILLAGAMSSVSAQSSKPYFTGTGAKGMTLAVLEPAGKGLSENELWVLSLIQGSITSDLNRYSAITIIDRQHVEKIMADVAQAMESGYYSEETMVRIGNMTNARYVLTGVVTKTANAIMLELSVTDAQSGERKWSYPPKPVSLTAIENLSVVKEASEDLLKRLGVALTAKGIEELRKPLAINQLQAENALARGVAAQRQGTEVAALSYFYQAAALDPSLLEATKRQKIITANITSGNIGADVRNEIAWRKSWVAKLTEFEEFFNKMVNTADPPYSFFYSTGIKRGQINFQTETIDLGIPTNLRAHAAWMNAVTQAANSVYGQLNTGLNATGKRNEWGLGNWPHQGVTDVSPFKSYTQKQYDIAIEFELLNDKKQAIGKQTVRLNPTFKLSGDNNSIVCNFSENAFHTVAFNAVNANDISDILTIRIVSVNGDVPENARFRITALPDAKWQESASLNVKLGVVTGFSQDQRHQALVIPDEVWGETIISIGNDAFQDAQLTSVTISNKVKSIGRGAFFKNRLSSITIPNSVTSIGEYAFMENQLTNVTIPNSVKSIGEAAFLENRLTNVTIPNSVTSIGNQMFMKNQLTNITIPNSVTSIGKMAFSGNLLTNVTIPNSVTSIGEQAFFQNLLTSVTIPNSVTSIGDGAFSFNKQLTRVTIGKNVKLNGYPFDKKCKIERQ